jgi:hypothetical protein
LESASRQDLPRANAAAKASFRHMPHFRQSFTRYARQRESMGCGTGCLIHLTLMSLLFVAFIIWCINNRAWELVITIIWPE